MINFFRNLNLKASKYNILIKNFSYLSVIQLASILLPLVAYPYLIRVLGKETYGLVVFAEAVIGYLQVLVSFGFNISATKEVSIHRENKKKLSEIISSIMIIKISLFILSFVLLSILLLILRMTQDYEILFYLTMWVCLYDVIFPIWYFQGIEQMKYITYISLVSRLIFLTLIFLLIHSPEDYLLLPFINGISAISAGTISIYIMLNVHKIKIVFPKLKRIKYYFMDSLPIFLSNVSIKLYVSTNKVILGAFCSMSEVAYYDLGEKITSVLKIPHALLSQTVFPKINKEKDIKFVKKLFPFSLSVNLFLFIVILFVSKPIVLILGGRKMFPSVLLVNILAISVPIIAMSNTFGIQVLIPFGETKKFSRVIISSGLVYLVQLFLIWLFLEINIYSVSLITVTTEVFVTAYMFYFCKKHHLW